jgi:hypothetical protein
MVALPSAGCDELPIYQVLPDMIELRVGDANSRLCAEQQEQTIAHPSMTSRCHSGRGLRSAGIAPIRNTIPPATQSSPTAASSAGEHTDAEL